MDGLIVPCLLLGLKLPACVRAGEELCICELICVCFFSQLLVGLARDVTVTRKPCLLVSPDIAALQSRHSFKLAGALFQRISFPQIPIISAVSPSPVPQLTGTEQSRSDKPLVLWCARHHGTLRAGLRPSLLLPARRLQSFIFQALVLPACFTCNLFCKAALP